MQNNITSCKQCYSVAADARPAISEVTSRLASENDSSSNTEDPFASANEDDGGERDHF